jgi:hypothetical protein
VWRDVDTPDLGYHYATLDYLASNVTVTATITLQDGVAVGLMGSAAFYLGAGSGWVSEGTVPELNRLVSHQTVQEQPQAWSGNKLFQVASSSSPSMQLRLTEISARPGSGLVLLDLYSTLPFSSFGLRDCQVHRGTFNLSPNTSTQVIVGLTNNLLDRCDLGLNHSYYSQNTPMGVNLYHNLHLGGYLRLNYDSSAVSNPIWVVRDNLFDGATQVLGGNAWTTYVQRSHNAYTAGSVNNLGGSPVFTGLNRDFQSGPLGFYSHMAGAGHGNRVVL